MRTVCVLLFKLIPHQGMLHPLLDVEVQRAHALQPPSRMEKLEQRILRVHRSGRTLGPYAGAFVGCRFTESVRESTEEI